MYRLLIAFALLFAAACPARAQSTLSSSLPPLAVQIANGSKISYASNGTPLSNMARSYAMGPVTGDIVATETGLLATPGGEVALGVARAVTWGALATAAAQVAAAGYVGWSIGSAYANYMGIGPASGGPTRCTATADGWFCDGGAVGSLQTMLCGQPSSWPGFHCATTATDFGTQWAAYVAGTKTYYCTTGTPAVTKYNTFVINHVTANAVYLDMVNACTGAVTSYSSVGLNSSQQSVCPAYVDALNPAWSGSAGAPLDADGLCRTGRYTAASVAAAAARLQAYADKTQAPALAPVLVAQGAQIPAASPSLSGPATKVQPTTTSTTTTSAGTTTVTNAPTYNYTYAGDTVTWNVTNVTSTTDPAGNTTTTTNTTNNTTSGDLCVTYPDRAGCRNMGDPPSAENLPTQTVNVSYSPDTGWGPDNGTCPGLVHTQLLGDVSVYALFCTYMSGIRFAVIGAAAILAAFIFIGRPE